MSVEDRLKELGYTLPPAQGPKGSYLTALRVGDLLYTAGMASFNGGELKYLGKVGRDLGVREGYEAAKLTALNLISVIREELGDLDRVERVVKLLAFVNCTGDFTEQPAVANGASDLLVEVFGEQGRHVRSAVGVYSLPMNFAVEIEMVVKVKE